MNLNLKDNIDYLGNGVDMEKMIKNARSHFEVLETDFSRSNDDDAYLKVFIYRVDLILNAKTILNAPFLASSDHYLTRKSYHKRSEPRIFKICCRLSNLVYDLDTM